MGWRMRLFGCVVVCLCSLGGCKDKETSTGSGVLSEEDGVVVFSDTFPLRSSVVDYPAILSVPDSLMLGELETNGLVYKCDILTQLACPLGFEYPQGATVDSAYLVFAYETYFGDANSPIYVSANFLDKNRLFYDRLYLSDIDVRDYCSMADSTYIFERDRLIIPSQKKDSIALVRTINNTVQEINIASVRIKLNDAFTKKLFSCRDFSSQEAFNEQLKGLYITTSLGSSAVLNVKSMAVELFYKFSYRRNDTQEDTTVTDIKYFPVNTEVKQINCFQVLNGETYLDSVQRSQTKYNYITSPVGVYTKLHVPMRHLQQQILSKIGHKRPYVNMARIRMKTTFDRNVTGKESWVKLPTFLVMMVDTLMDTYFGKNTLFTTTDFGSLDTTGNYTFRLDNFLTSQLRDSINEDTLRLCLIPVEGSYGSSTSILTKIKQKQTLSSITVPSADNDSTPLMLEVVYSGF